MKTFAINPMTREVFRYDQTLHQYVYFIITTDCTEQQLIQILEAYTGTLFLSLLFQRIREAGHECVEGINKPL